MSSSGPGDGAGRPAAGAAVLASELPDVRNRLIDYLRLGPAQNLTREVLAMHVASGLQLPADPAVRDPRRQADLLITNELTRLRNARLFWVSPDMTALCQAEAGTMPAFRPGRGDLPAPCGLMYFAAPLGRYEPLPRIILEQGGGASAVLPGEPVPVCAVTWSPWNANGAWPGGGTWFTFYSRPPLDLGDLAERYGLRPEDAARIRVPPLMIDNELACPAWETVPLERPLEDAVGDPDSLFAWMHLVLCAARIIAASRLAAVTAQPLPRHVRKRSRSAGVMAPEDPVRLVDIQATRPRRQASGEDARHGSPQVRFRVSTHWRNQWYPRSGVHRPVLIDEFIKGPPGAPFRALRKVYVLRRPGETVRPPRPDAGQELEP